MHMNKKSYDIAIAYAQAQPAGQERAKVYEIARCAQRADSSGIAFAVANDHRSEIHIEMAIMMCVDIGIAKNEGVNAPKIVFLDGSTWERDGCTEACV